MNKYTIQPIVIFQYLQHCIISYMWLSFHCMLFSFMNVFHFTHLDCEISKGKKNLCLYFSGVLHDIYHIIDYRTGIQQTFVEFLHWRSLVSRCCISAPWPLKLAKSKSIIGLGNVWNLYSRCSTRIKSGLARARLRVVVAYSWPSVTLVEKIDQICYRHSVTQRSLLLTECNFHCLTLEPCGMKPVCWFYKIKIHLWEKILNKFKIWRT